jgi:hypothetical protein
VEKQNYKRLESQKKNNKVGWKKKRMDVTINKE